MPDRVAVLREGVVQQVDTPENIYHRPASRSVATVIGSPPMNFIPAVVGSSNGRLAYRARAVRDRIGGPGQHKRLSAGAPCFVGIRPEDIQVAHSGEGLVAKVYATEPLGGETVVDVTLGDRVVKLIAPSTLTLTQDADIRIVLDASACTCSTSRV